MLKISIAIDKVKFIPCYNFSSSMYWKDKQYYKIVTNSILSQLPRFFQNFVINPWSLYWNISCYYLWTEKHIMYNISYRYMVHIGRPIFSRPRSSHSRPSPNIYYNHPPSYTCILTYYFKSEFNRSAFREILVFINFFIYNIYIYTFAA